MSEAHHFGPLWTSCPLLFILCLFVFKPVLSSSPNQLALRTIWQRCYDSDVSALMFSLIRLVNVRETVRLRVVWYGWWVGVVVVYREDSRLSSILAGVDWRNLAWPVTTTTTLIFFCSATGPRPIRAVVSRNDPEVPRVARPEGQRHRALTRMQSERCTGQWKRRQFSSVLILMTNNISCNTSASMYCT